MSSSLRIRKRNIILFIIGIFTFGALLGFLVNLILPLSQIPSITFKEGFWGIVGDITLVLFLFSIPIGYFVWLIIGLSQIARPKEPSKRIRPENIPQNIKTVEKILIPVGDGPNVLLGLQLVSQLSSVEKGKITLLRIIPPSSSADIETQRKLVRNMAHQSLLDYQHDFEIDVVIKISNNLIEAILETARSDKYDLLILGASERTHVGSLIFGTIPYKLAKLSPCPVMIIRKPSVE